MAVGAPGEVGIGIGIEIEIEAGTDVGDPVRRVGGHGVHGGGHGRGRVSVSVCRGVRLPAGPGGMTAAAAATVEAGS